MAAFIALLVFMGLSALKEDGAAQKEQPTTQTPARRRRRACVDHHA